MEEAKEMEVADELKDAVVDPGSEDEDEDCTPTKTYAEVEELLRLVTKIAATKPKIKLKIAKRKHALNWIMEPVLEAREVPKEMNAYNEAHIAILRKHGTPVGGQGNSYSVPNEKLAEVDEEIKALDEKYAEILAREEIRRKEVVEMMKEEVEFDVPPLKYDWVATLDTINSNDIERFMALDWIEIPDDEDDEDDGEDEGSEEERRERSRMERNRRRNNKKRR